jgi:hypothetical protein
VSIFDSNNCIDFTVKLNKQFEITLTELKKQYKAYLEVRSSSYNIFNESQVIWSKDKSKWQM